MIENCAGFGWLSQSVSVSGGDDNLTYSALRLRSAQHMKSVQFMTDFHSIIILSFYYNF